MNLCTFSELPESVQIIGSVGVVVVVALFVYGLFVKD